MQVKHLTANDLCYYNPIGRNEVDERAVGAAPGVFACVSELLQLTLRAEDFCLLSADL